MQDQTNIFLQIKTELNVVMHYKQTTHLLITVVPLVLHTCLIYNSVRRSVPAKGAVTIIAATKLTTSCIEHGQKSTLKQVTS